jgi:hypothetical protein
MNDSNSTEKKKCDLPRKGHFSPLERDIGFCIAKVLSFRPMSIYELSNLLCEDTKTVRDNVSILCNSGKLLHETISRKGRKVAIHSYCGDWKELHDGERKIAQRAFAKREMLVETIKIGLEQVMGQQNRIEMQGRKIWSGWPNIRRIKDPKLQFFLHLFKKFKIGGDELSEPSLKVLTKLPYKTRDAIEYYFRPLAPLIGLGGVDNVEQTSWCIGTLCAAYRNGFISKDEIKERIEGAVEFILDQKVEWDNYVAWRNPYMDGTPECPSVTGKVLTSLLNLEKEKILPDFKVPQDIKDYSCNFIEDYLGEFLKKMTIFCMQNPAMTILYAITAYIKAKGKNDNEFVRKGFQTLMSYQDKKTGGFMPHIRSPSVKPDSQITSTMIVQILDSEYMDFDINDIKKFDLTLPLAKARRFLLPKEGEKIPVTRSHPEITMLHLQALLLLGVHPLNSRWVNPIIDSMVSSIKDREFENHVEQLDHTVYRLIRYFERLKESTDPTYWEKLKKYLDEGIIDLEL